MKAIFDFLDGKKSYIGAGLIAFASFLQLIGVDKGVCDLVKQIGEALFGIGIANKIVKATAK